MHEVSVAARKVLAEVFRPTFRTGEALDIWEVLGNVLRWFSVPGGSGIAWWLQSMIPGVKNLYPWAFPLIVANSIFAVLLFVAAIRLQLPRDRAVLRLAQLVSEGIQGRNEGLKVGTVDAVAPWITTYYSWEHEVLEELNQISPVDAELWRLMGDVPQAFTKGVSVDHVRYLNYWTLQYQRLRDAIEKVRP